MKTSRNLINDEIIFKSLVQAIPDIIYIIDENGLLTFVNDAVYKLGYEPLELIGKHISTLLPEEDIPTVFREHVMSSMAGTSPSPDNPPKLIDERRTGSRITKNLKLRLLHKENQSDKSRFMDAEAVAVGLHEIGTGKPGANFLGTIGVIKDMSEIKKSEMTLTKTIRYYEMLIENISNVIIIAAIDGTLLYTSPSIERILGYERTELIGENKLEYIHSDDREPIAGLFTDGDAQGITDDYLEFRFLNKKGEWTLFESSIRPTLDGSNNLVCLIFYLNDITMRRTAEDDLKKSEKRFRAIVENAEDIIFRYRLRPTRGFDYISPAVETISGLTRDDFYNNPDLFLRLISPEDKHLVESVSDERIRVKKPFTLRWKLDDGRTICTEQSNVPVTDDSGAIIAVEGIARDITEREKTQDSLKKSLKEKEILLTEIHHRVKNNLQIISSLLSLQSQGLRDASVQDLFMDTQNRIQSIALIHNLMYKSRDLANVDFEEYIQNLAAVLLRTLSKNRHKIKLDVEAENVSLDLNRAIPCGLIINEIVSNSIKHAFPDGGPGKISIRFSGKTSDMYKLTVRDNGIGMDTAFDPGKSETIGLTIIRDLTEQLKGTLMIQANRGTEITIRFPKKKPI